MPYSRKIVSCMEWRRLSASLSCNMDFCVRLWQFAHLSRDSSAYGFLFQLTAAVGI